MADHNRTIVIDPPVGDPFDLDLLKAHMNLGDDSDDDDLIVAYAQAAADMIEGMGIPILPQTVRTSFDRVEFESYTLPLGPVSEVVAVRLRDYGGTYETLDPSTYTVSLDRTRAKVNLYGLSPYLLQNNLLNGSYFGGYLLGGYLNLDAVQIDYRVGYATIPSGIVHAARLIVANLYVNREAVVGIGSRDSPAEVPITGVSELLARYKPINF